MTVATILATSQISAGSLYAPLSTISNLVSTNTTLGNIAGNTQILDTVNFVVGFTAANIKATTSSISNMVLTAGTIGNIAGNTVFNETVGFTVGFTSANAFITNSSVGTMWATTTSSGNHYVTSDLYANTVKITPSLGDIGSEVSFSAANDQSAAANITSLAFSNAVVRAFQCIVSVTIVKSNGSNLYANFELKGIQKGSSWVVNSSYVGDYTGIVFSITNAGQIQYTSTNTLLWTSTTMKFRGYTTSI